ncbi:MAG: hypothetical protein ABSD72_13845 [Terracidiphilus sp.]|jgi:hypothetical protein
MRKLVAVVFLLLGFITPISGQKTRYGQEPPHAKKGVDYPIKVHITGMHIGAYCTSHWDDRYGYSCSSALYADVILDGKKLELRGDWAYSNNQFRLLPGNYDARLLKANHQAGDSPINDIYELRTPDNRILRGTVTGISE